MPQNDTTPRPLGRVLLTGGTGMVGSSVLSSLRAADSTTEIVSLGRRLSGKTYPKLHEVTFTEFGNPEAYVPYLHGIDTVFHCLATYSARVSREDYKMITVDWLRTLLTACEAYAPNATFCLFSAQGARPDGGGCPLHFRRRARQRACYSHQVSHAGSRFVQDTSRRPVLGAAGNWQTTFSNLYNGSCRRLA